MASLPRHPTADCFVFWVGVSTLLVFCLPGCAIIDGAPSLFGDSNNTTVNNTTPNNSTANNTTPNNSTNNSTSNNATTPEDECGEDKACGDGQACVLYGVSNRCVGVLETPVELSDPAQQDNSLLLDLHQETNRLMVATSFFSGANLDVSLWSIDLDEVEATSPKTSQIPAQSDGLGAGLTSIATMRDGTLFTLRTGEFSNGTGTATFLWSQGDEAPLPFSFEFDVPTAEGGAVTASSDAAFFTNQEHGAVVATRATDASFLVAGHLCTQEELDDNGPCGLRLWKLDTNGLSSISEDNPSYAGTAQVISFDAGAIDDMTAPWQFETNPGPDGELLHSLIGFYKDNESRNALSYVTFAGDEADKEAIASSEAAVDVRLLSPLLAKPAFDSGCGEIGPTDLDTLPFGSMGLLQSPRSTGESLLFFDYGIPGENDKAGVAIGYTYKDDPVMGRRQFVKCLPTPTADETTFLAVHNKDAPLNLPTANLDILLKQVDGGEHTLVIVSSEEDILGGDDPSVVVIDMPDDIDFELIDAWATEDDFLVAARETSGERRGQLTLLRIPYPD